MYCIHYILQDFLPSINYSQSANNGYYDSSYHTTMATMMTTMATMMTAMATMMIVTTMKATMVTTTTHPVITHHMSLVIPL